MHAQTLAAVHPQLGELIVSRNRMYNGQAHWVATFYDEDEFAAHRVLMNYPAEPCTRMESATAALMDAVAARQAPFDGRDAAWFTLGRSLP